MSIGDHPWPSRRGFSLLELLAVVVILGTIAMVVVPRVSSTVSSADESTAEMNRAVINAAVERYFLDHGEWPANDLSDIGADPNYFPEPIPPNPVTGNPYELDPVTHRVKTSGGGDGK